MMKIVQQTYLEQVTEDVTNYLVENFTEDVVADYCGEWEDFIEHLYDELWNTDSVTGNASGSYWFSRALAENMVLSNLGEVKFALLEFDMLDDLGRLIVDEEWERIDVIVRCHALNTAIYDALEQLGWYRG